ncbi:MAG: hypothetical protein HYU67_09845 [Flavobacteriia bacterium]|nr:hypothetical protein [Flavobacteriia bacterium]
MKKIFIIFYCILSYVVLSQDIINYKNGNIDTVKVIEINKTAIKYKKTNNIDGPLYTCLKDVIISVQFENGTIESFQSENTVIVNDEVIKNAAIADSWKHYVGYKKGKVFTMLGTAILTPIGGYFIARKFAKREITNADIPLKIKVKGFDGTIYLDNPNLDNQLYQDKFKEISKSKQKIKVWLSYMAGSMINVGLAGVITLDVLFSDY